MALGGLVVEQWLSGQRGLGFDTDQTLLDVIFIVGIYPGSVVVSGEGCWQLGGVLLASLKGHWEW